MSGARVSFYFWRADGGKENWNDRPPTKLSIKRHYQAIQKYTFTVCPTVRESRTAGVTKSLSLPFSIDVNYRSGAAVLEQLMYKEKVNKYTGINHACLDMQ